MRLSRCHIDHPLETGLKVTLNPKTSHYLSRVLRLHTGSSISLFNGNGYNYLGTIENSGKQLEVFITEKSDIEPPPKLTIHLALGLSKGERFDLAIQKATELGVNTITPLLTEYKAIKLNADRLKKKQQHWQGIIASACEQSGRCYLPTLNTTRPFPQWIDEQPQDSLNLLLTPAGEYSLKQLTPQNNITLLIGPEGGWSDIEQEQAKSKHFIDVKLGKHILRTETAPLAVIAGLQTLWGEFC